MPQSPDIGQNSGRGIFYFRISGQSLIKENCHNCRTSDDIDIKLRPLLELDKSNKTTSKKLKLTSHQEIMTSLSFFGLLANLEQSGGRIPDTESTKVMFSVVVTFYLKNNENRTKKSLTQLSHYLLLVKVLFWTKNNNFLQKMLTSAKLRWPRH